MRVRKRLCLLILFLICLFLIGCKKSSTIEESFTDEPTIGETNDSEERMEEILHQFNLTDPKRIWGDNIKVDYRDDQILVYLRKSYTYPEIDMKFFGLSNAIRMESLRGLRPPEHYFSPENEHLLSEFRQVVFVYIIPQGKEAVVEAIRQLEEVPFVRSVFPNYILELPRVPGEWEIWF
jgi:hypothetical protein